MPKFIPTFPIEIIVFPTENLNLQIKEGELIEIIENTLVSEDKIFGLLPIIDGEVQNYGTTIKVIDAYYLDDGKTMNLKSIGKDVFEIISKIDEIPEKNYKGAIIEILKTEEANATDELREVISNELMRLFNLLNAYPHGPIPKLLSSSYDIAHKVGMNIKEEYEFLQLKNEMHRQEYIRRHLKRLEPILNKLEHIKKKILMNGDYKTL